MLSIYLGLDTLRPYILYSLFVVYFSIQIIVGYRIQQMTIQRKIENAERLGIIIWQFVWGLFCILLLFRDLNFINDIGMIGGIILFLVLMFTIITSCYVIIKDSRYWIEQIFAVTALHWIFFHDSESWLSNTPYMLLIPVITMAMSRIVFFVETNEQPFDAIIEGICWTAIFILEILYDSGQIIKPVFFLFTAICFLGNIIQKNEKIITLIIITAPISVPILWWHVLYHVYKRGYVNGLMHAHILLETKWRKLTGEEATIIKSILSNSEPLPESNSNHDIL